MPTGHRSAPRGSGRHCSCESLDSSPVCMDLCMMSVREKVWMGGGEGCRTVWMFVWDGLVCVCVCI